MARPGLRHDMNTFTTLSCLSVFLMSACASELSPVCAEAPEALFYGLPAERAGLDPDLLLAIGVLRDASNELVCSAVLVSANWALTVDHCGVSGELYFASGADDTPWNVAKVTRRVYDSSSTLLLLRP